MNYNGLSSSACERLRHGICRLPSWLFLFAKHKTQSDRNVLGLALVATSLTREIPQEVICATI